VWDSGRRSAFKGNEVSRNGRVSVKGKKKATQKKKKNEERRNNNFEQNGGSRVAERE